MIDPLEALNALTRVGVEFFAGVPDSLLKDLNACIADQVDPSRHVVAHNEGGAIALAAGHYLATGRPGLVYMQNSGLGNAINPLVSLTSLEVYGFPMVLMIGWRGEPGRHDEPQHTHQGRVTEEMLSTLNVPVFHLSADTVDWAERIADAVAETEHSRRPTALLVSSKTFSSYPSRAVHDGSELPRRIDVLEAIVGRLPRDTFFVATTGYTSRELAALRAKSGDSPDRDFLGVGSMGHAAAVALGLALAQPEVEVVCLDGDGSLAMHLGVMALIGDQRPANFGHILINNRVHESVGGQPTALKRADAVGIARACGYGKATSCASLEDLDVLLETAAGADGPWFIEAQVSTGTLTDLPRPDDFSTRMGRLRQSLSN